ncbi:hypothetical protein TCON_2435 [Astathelohania contejeani]|uniref:Uncharacterized protein n=1 Tax=Astathelohania contejeani TaxID=164912 RepID=A0ABQ7HW47_9MICR|nr:hypothetical protein TCON_2435 [Thelohania contejeani]
MNKMNSILNDIINKEDTTVNLRRLNQELKGNKPNKIAFLTRLKNKPDLAIALLKDQISQLDQAQLLLAIFRVLTEKFIRPIMQTYTSDFLRINSQSFDSDSRNFLLNFNKDNSKVFGFEITHFKNVNDSNSGVNICTNSFVFFNEPNICIHHEKDLLLINYQSIESYELHESNLVLKLSKNRTVSFKMIECDEKKVKLKIENKIYDKTKINEEDKMINNTHIKNIPGVEINGSKLKISHPNENLCIITQPPIKEQIDLSKNLTLTFKTKEEPAYATLLNEISHGNESNSQENTNYKHKFFNKDNKKIRKQRNKKIMHSGLELLKHTKLILRRIEKEIIKRKRVELKKIYDRLENFKKIKFNYHYVLLNH